MQLPRYTKSSLYREVEKFRRSFGIGSNYPLDAIALAEASGLSVDTCNFKTRGLKGTIVVDGANGFIVLDSKESPEEKNFFCGHETFHYVFHRDISMTSTSFQCFDKVKPQQNSIVEWQANEGAAQLLVPYQDFIPCFVKCLRRKRRGLWIQGCLAKRYCVTPQVINNRLDSLSYEIDQYCCGVPLSDIEILSRNQRNQRGIKTTSYEAVCDFLPNRSGDNEVG